MSSPPAEADTPPQPASHFQPTPSDPAPSTSEPSPLLPTPSTPAPASPPRLTYEQKGKRKQTAVRDDSPRALRERHSSSASAPLLVLGAPMEGSVYNREKTPPPVDLDRTDSPPRSLRITYSKSRGTPAKCPPTSGSLQCRVISSSYSPPPRTRSPPSPTRPTPIRGLAPSPPNLQAEAPLVLSLSLMTLPVPPTDWARDKLDYFDLPKRGVQVFPPDDVKKGETILRTSPLHGVLHTPLLYTHCSGCFLSPEHKAKHMRITLTAARKLFQECTRCEVALFCSVVSRPGRSQLKRLRRDAMRRLRRPILTNVERCGTFLLRHRRTSV